MAPRAQKNFFQGRKEMFYLMTHSTHFYLRLYGIRHMVKDHSDSERGNPLPPDGLFEDANNSYNIINLKLLTQIFR